MMQPLFIRTPDIEQEALSDFKGPQLFFVEKKTGYALVEKTIELTRSISLLTNLLWTKLYPHTDFYSHNSPYLHARAAAINNPVSQSEITHYISHESGHQGFLAMIKAHAENNRRDEGKRYFKIFLQFCDFLVN